MGEPVRVDLFVEDAAQEQFARSMVERMGREEGSTLVVSARSARGGSGRVLRELGVFQRGLKSGSLAAPMPDLLVVLVDADDLGWSARRSEVEAMIDPENIPRSVVRCPDPHVEAWYWPTRRASGKSSVHRC